MSCCRPGGCRAQRTKTKREGDAFVPRGVDPEEAAAVMRAAGLEPVVPYPGAKTPWTCRCVKRGHVVSPSFRSVRSGASSGCRHCGRAAAADRRRLEGQEQAEKDMLAASYEPLEPYPGARGKWRCRHLTCGGVVFPRLTNIRAGQGGCRACVGLAPVSPAVAVAEMRAIGMEPLVPYPGRVRARWRRRCTSCGHIGTPNLNNIRRGQGGCCGCARRRTSSGAAGAKQRRT